MPKSNAADISLDDLIKEIETGEAPSPVKAAATPRRKVEGASKKPENVRPAVWNANAKRGFKDLCRKHFVILGQINDLQLKLKGNGKEKGEEGYVEGIDSKIEGIVQRHGTKVERDLFIYTDPYKAQLKLGKDKAYDADKALVYATQREPDLVDVSDVETLDIFALRLLVKAKTLPSQVLALVKELEKILEASQVEGIIQKEHHEMIAWDRWEEYAKEGRIPARVLKACEVPVTGTSKLIMHDLKDLGPRCSHCGEKKPKRLATGAVCKRCKHPLE